MPEIKVIIFDVGGVLVELVGGEKMMEWTAGRYASMPEMYHDWIMCPAVQQFERGHCSSDAFSEEVVRDLDLPVSPAEFLEEFMKWPNGLLPGIRETLESVKQSYSIACLSNTNSAHWYSQRDTEFLNIIFDNMFLSFQMGMVKPDDEIYRETVRRLGTNPEQILFLEDNRVNVEAAARCGINAELALGTEQVRDVLTRYGCIN